jgi:hypothetical protein
VAGDQAAQRRDRLPAVLDLRERGARVGQQGLAGRGQRDRAPVPVEQPFTELGLQALDLLADRGLSDVEPFGGPGEVRLVDDREEVGELPEFHKQSLSR